MKSLTTPGLVFALDLLGCGFGYFLEPPWYWFLFNADSRDRTSFEHGLTRNLGYVNTLNPGLGPEGSRHSQQAVFAALPALVWVIFATFAVSG